MEETHKYDDIINKEHPTSPRHPRMDAITRAAQFSPFKALTGLEDDVEETTMQNTSSVLNEVEHEPDPDYIEYLEKEKGN
ncbi:MAG: hypothetical protein K5675_03850 [Lachnospiraceae bacterium]|nr:hypothetical protein [Lachnospiraceae bacterium]